MNYTPNTELAFLSVERIMRDVNYGWLLRYTHAVGASMFFIIVSIFISCEGCIMALTKHLRELLWGIGVVIYLFNHDGYGLFGLCFAVGTNVILGRNRYYQSFLGHSVGW